MCIMLHTLAETDWIIFIGRLHPIFVHLPIGMIAAVVIVEAMTLVTKPKKVSTTRKVLLWATAASATASVVAGWFLADEGGYPEDLLFWHRWLGIAFASVLLLGALIALTPRWSSVVVRSFVLLFALVLMTVAGHMGGTMTHGETYLTRYAPPLIANLLGPAGEAEESLPLDMVEQVGDAQIVMAMLEARCVECHGASKQKGRLRLDTPEGIGTVVTAGDPSASELFRRISLPADDFDIMPPEGGAIADDEVLAVMRWIRDGAEMTPTPTPAPTLAPTPEAEVPTETATGEGVPGDADDSVPAPDVNEAETDEDAP